TRELVCHGLRQRRPPTVLESVYDVSAAPARHPAHRACLAHVWVQDMAPAARIRHSWVPTALTARRGKRRKPRKAQPTEDMLLPRGERSVTDGTGARKAHAKDRASGVRRMRKYR
ncbi:MAG TPA: hypothetical protein VJ717_10125, partial [Gemmatimonadaceae bacterium]|nr:hypothetical protein [Gemmatimonadaceae bacterium]